MKTYSKTQLEEKAKGIFESYPLAKALYATSDGQFFLNENRADLYVKGKKLSTIKIERPLQESDTETDSNGLPDANATKTIEFIEKSENVDDLKVWLKFETANKDRKTVKAAIEDRIAELETSKLLETISSTDSEEGLKVIQQKEQASENPREEVLSAIEARLTELKK